ncbi:hypothetical protein [Argonema galeatum]|uniref:hypothetical protein n=1 Tax=Argonema galeatum TaxID=2942762 RepID=UPI002011D2B6|nr:hypothetical protein [Argonema galeatum]MCL1464577.1 hypothetical protein [Argonema galeatum A003/A1]
MQRLYRVTGNAPLISGDVYFICLLVAIATHIFVSSHYKGNIGNIKKVSSNESLAKSQKGSSHLWQMH